MQPRACPLCRSESTSTLYAESTFDPRTLDQFAFASRKVPEYQHHRLMLCSACDLLYVSPMPDELAYRSGYQGAAFDSGKESTFAARTYLHALRPVLTRLADLTSALDIGAGDGAFVGELLRAGFKDVVGLEPSAAPLAAAAETIRPHLQAGFFERGLFPRESFSLVTCFQTIEHVFDPVELCSAAFETLKPGGALCLVGHNRRALSAKILGRRSPIFDLEHLQLFSQVSFEKLITSAGLQQVSVRPLWNRYPLSYWTRLFPFPGPMKRSLTSGLQATGLGRIPVSIPAGNLVAIGYKPRSP